MTPKKENTMSHEYTLSRREERSGRNTDHPATGTESRLSRTSGPLPAPSPAPDPARPAESDTAGPWVFELPWATPPVKPNGGHGNVYAHAAKVRQARQVMGLLARRAGVPFLGRCRVQLVWHVPDRIARDADNLVWTLKPLCDALSSGRKPTDHVIVEDDTPDFMVKDMPAIVYEKGCVKRLTLTVFPLDAYPNTA